MSGSGLEYRWSKLQSKIFRRTGSKDSEDLLQTSLLRMIEKGQEKVTNPEAFLMRSAMNQMRDNYRRSRHPAAPRELEPEHYAVSDDSPMPDESLIAKQRLARVQQGLEHLSPRTKEIFLMHRLDGMKYREIADHLGISTSAVEKHISKAMQFLISWSEDW